MIKNLSSNTNADSNIDEDFIDNSLIGNLAKELSNELDMTSMNIDPENTNNVGDVFSNLLSGDNPMKFMNLIQNVGKKIHAKLENQDLDQNKLVEEAQSMMGMLGNINPLFDNLLNGAKKEMKVPQNNSTPSHDNPTRDRLRKKLEERKKKKE